MRGVPPQLPAHLPLTGADCFLRAFEHEIRRCAGSSHSSQLVLRLGPGFDVGIFAKLVEEMARAQPIVRAPIRRRFGLGRGAHRRGGALLSDIAEKEFIHGTTVSQEGSVTSNSF